MSTIRNGPSRTASQRHHNAVSLTALDAWKESQLPFSSANLGKLATAGLIADVDSVLRGDSSYSWHSIAVDISTFVSARRATHQHRFLIPDGNLPVLCSVLRLMVADHYSEDLKSLPKWLTIGIADALETKRVCFLPWSPSSTTLVSSATWIAVQPSIAKRSREDDEDEDEDDDADEDEHANPFAPVQKKLKAAGKVARALAALDHARGFTLTPRMHVNHIMPFLDRTREPDNFNLLKRAGKSAFARSLVASFDMKKPEQRIGVLVSFILAPLLPLIKVELPDDVDEYDIKSPRDALKLMRSDVVTFGQSSKGENARGLTEPTPWLEAFSLGWVFWLKVRDGECEVGSQSQKGPETKFRNKLGMYSIRSVLILCV